MFNPQNQFSPNGRDKKSAPKPLISDLVTNAQNAENEARRARDEQRAINRSKFTPTLALIIANIIFISLDFRVFDAVNKVTKSPLLAGLTLLATGVIVLVWWDFFLPHSKKHGNKDQKLMCNIGLPLGIILTAILSFLDYAYLTLQFNINLIWGLVIVVTVVQGFLIAHFWEVDHAIDAEAAANAELAQRLAMQRAVESFRVQLGGIQTVAGAVEALMPMFRSKDDAILLAQSMGFPQLAEMIRAQDSPQQQSPKPFQPPAAQPPRPAMPAQQTYASDVDEEKQVKNR